MWFAGYVLRPAGDSSTTVFYMALVDFPVNIKIATSFATKVLMKRAKGIFKIRKLVREKKIQGSLDEWREFLQQHKNNHLK